MPAQLLVISQREEDLRFGEFIAFANNMQVANALSPKQVKEAISANNQTVVFWGADDTEMASPIGEILGPLTSPSRVVAVTDGPLKEHPHLFKYPVFGHHFFRRFDNPAPILFSKIIGAAIEAQPFHLLRYFPAKTKGHQIKLTRSGQKGSAIVAIHKHLEKLGVANRLSTLVSQASDELIMNALFDAPTLPDGALMRRGTDRHADFELVDKEHVVVDISETEDYIGICIADKFGSLKKGLVLRFLGKDYQANEYVPRTDDPGAGLGILGIIQSGLSLLFVCKPGVRTEVMIFFPRSPNYKQFKMGFRFVSLLSP
jgi:hypothetical protein